MSKIMNQYNETKKANPDSIVMVRSAEYYQTFYDDAITACNELSIAVTGGDYGMAKRVPVCNIPDHLLDKHISRLIDKGYKVTVCEKI